MVEELSFGLACHFSVGHALIDTFDLLCGTPIWLMLTYYVSVGIISFLVFLKFKKLSYMVLVLTIGLLMIFYLKWNVINYLVNDNLLTEQEGKEYLQQILFEPFKLYL